MDRAWSAARSPTASIACARPPHERRLELSCGRISLLILVGYLPNEIWRVLGLVLARGLNEDSEIVVWSRAVATA